MIKKIAKKLKSFPIFRVMGLMTVMTVAFSASFAKYITDKAGSIGGDVVKPYSSFTVDQSGLNNFADSKYEPNLSTVERTGITFTNYETAGGVTNISAFDLTYELVFYIPEVFAKSAAIQLTTTDEDGKDKAVTPLLVLYELDAGTLTTDSDRFDGVTDCDTTYAKEDFENGYTLTAADKTHTVKVEKQEMQGTYQHVFPTYIAGTDDPLAAILYTVETTMTYWKLTFSATAFMMNANTEISHNYDFHLRPVKQMGPPDVLDENDDSANYDDAFLVNWDDLLGRDTFNAANLSMRNKGWTYTLGDGNTVSLTEPQLKEDGTPMLDENNNVLVKATYENVRVGMVTDGDNNKNGRSHGKYYPCRLSAIITQASDKKEDMV